MNERISYVCYWKYIDRDYYTTSCNNDFWLEGTLKDQDVYMFCPGCGRAINEVLPEPPDSHAPSDCAPTGRNIESGPGQ